MPNLVEKVSSERFNDFKVLEKISPLNTAFGAHTNYI
jgi:hypothetical protein